MLIPGTTTSNDPCPFDAAPSHISLSFVIRFELFNLQYSPKYLVRIASRVAFQIKESKFIVLDKQLLSTEINSEFNGTAMF